MFPTNIHSCIIIDNDKINIRKITYNLNKYFDYIQILAISQNPKQVESLIIEHCPEILILDIDMLDSSKYDLFLKSRGLKFETLYTTSKQNNAVDAFAFTSSNYLKKPIQDELFVTAINQCLNKLVETRNLNLLSTLLQESRKIYEISTIALPTVSGFIIRNIKDIVHIESESRYAVFHFVDGTKYVSSYNIGKYKSLLDNGLFIQTHKSHLVNKLHIREYSKSGFIQMSNKKRIPVSKNHRKTLISQVRQY